jgi:hypothetical protein
MYLIAAPSYGYFRDELYYLACGEHPAREYVDQLPLIAWMAWLLQHSIGSSLYTLRMLPHGVNYDLPREAEDFVHRVGRTGRAASHGVASTFAAPDEAHALKKIERTLAINTKKYRVRPNAAACGQVARSVSAC